MWLRENSTKTMTKVNEVAVEAARKRKKGDSYTANVYGRKSADRTEHGNDVIFLVFWPLFSAI